jgi:hypothetical protein
MKIAIEVCVIGLTCACLLGSGALQADDDHHHDVKAPGVEVKHKENGRVRVKAPFVEVETDGKGGTKVDAPFHRSDTRDLPPEKPRPATPAESTKMIQYSRPDGLYSLVVPAGWQPFPNNDSSVAGFHDPSDQAAVKVVILSDRLYKPSDLKSASEQACKKCQDVLSELKVLASANSTLGNQPAIRTDVTFARKGIPTRGVMFVSIQGERAAVLMTLRADAASFDAWAPTLYAIVGSYRSGGK